MNSCCDFRMQAEWRKVDLQSQWTLSRGAKYLGSDSRMGVVEETFKSDRVNNHSLDINFTHCEFVI